MKRIYLTGVMILAATLMLQAGINPGEPAKEFTLKNVDGKSVSLSDYKDQKGVILVFTCNPCPYAKAYEGRIIKLHEKYAGKGFPVVAINPNDDEVSKEDSWEKMKALAREKDYPFPYLKDETQEVFKSYGATRTPHIFLLKNEGKNFEVAYIGAIDDNAMDAKGVEKHYLENAIMALQAGNNPDPVLTKAVGCSIKVQK